MAISYEIFERISEKLLGNLKFSEEGNISLSSFKEEVEKIAKENPDISEEIYKFSSCFIKFTKKVTEKFALSLLSKRAA